MKFKCIYEDISKAIMSITKVNSKSSVFPIIELIHIEANDNDIVFRATNLELILEVSIKAKIEMKGKFVINYNNISKIINIVKSEIIEFELIDNILHINSGKSKIKLQTSVYEDIPHLPVVDAIKNIKDGNESLNLKKEYFVDGVKKVMFAVANTEIKPEISSIYIYNKNNFLYTVATDTFRLAENKIAIDSDWSDNKISLLVPGKSMNIIIPIIENIRDEYIDINKYEDGIIIGSQNVFIAVRTINGNFPDYTQLYPKEWLGVISVEKIALVTNLNATVLFKDSYSYSKISIIDQNIKIQTNNNNIGSFESEIDIQNPTEEYKQSDLSKIEIEANYNSSLLLEGLNKIESNKINMYYTTPNKAVFIKAVNNSNFTYLLMPLNK